MSQDWARSVFATVDGMSGEKFAALFAEDGEFVFGNSAPLVGQAAIGKMVSEFFSLYQSISHTLTHVWYEGDTAIVEGDVFYTLFDQQVVTVPFVSIIDQGDGGIKSYRSFVDLAPLMSALNLKS